MDDKTTTNAPVEDGGSQIQGVPVDDQGRAVEEPQPQQQEQAEAVAPESSDTSQEAPQEEAEPEKTDNSTDEWLKKKGIDPKSPEAVEKVAEMARNAEKAMHEKAQKASELEKATKITDDQLPQDATQEQVERVDVRNLQLRMDIQDWKRDNPDKLVYEGKMAEVLSDPNKKVMVQEGYLSLDDVYNMAKGSDSSQEAIKSQVQKDTLTNLAQKQQAAVPTGNAVNPSGTGAESITPDNVDRLVASNSQEWFEKNYEAINKAMSGSR